MGVVPRTWPWAYARVEARGETYVRIMSWHNGDPGTTPEQEERLEHVRAATRTVRLHMCMMVCRPSAEACCERHRGVEGQGRLLLSTLAPNT